MVLTQVDTILAIGSSNMAGFGANLYDVPTADYIRWLSQATPLPPPGAPTRPYVATMPGVRMWTPRRPFSVNAQRAVAGVTPPSIITHGGAAITPAASSTNADRWMFILRGTGRGNVRRIVLYDGVGLTIQVDPAFSPAPVATDTAVLLQDSHTLHSVASDGLSITKVSFTPRTVTFNGATERVVLAAHGYVLAQAVFFEGGTPPVEIVPGTVYYVTNINAGDFQLATTAALAAAGTNFAFTGNGTGTTTVRAADATPDFTSAVVGRYVSFFDSPAGGETARKIASQTATTLTFDQPLTGFPAATSFPVVAAQVVTFDGATERVTLAAHGFAAGQPVVFAGGTPPVEIALGTTYYATNVLAGSFQLATTLALALAGTNFTLTGNGTGTTTATPVHVATFDGTSERVVFAGHNAIAGTPVVFVGGTPPAEVVALTVYYATNVATGSFQLATTLANALDGTNFTLTGNGSGTTTVTPTVNGFCVLTGADSSEGITTMQPPTAVLQDLTFTLDEVSPVYLTGLEYPNWDFTPFVSPRALSNDPTVNSIAELTWQVRSKIAQPLVCVQIGVSASMISPFALDPATARTLVGPLHDITNLDFHPSIPLGIYTIVANAITSVTALLAAEGKTPKWRGIFINLFDNDPTADVVRLLRIGANTVLLRNAVRTLLGDQNVPWIMAGPSAYAGGPGHPANTEVYRQLFAIAAEDEQSGVVDTRVGYTYSEDTLHFSAFSQIKLGREFFRVWQPIHDDLVGAPPVIDIEISNSALMVIGESPNITSLDPPLGSAHAPLAALRYPVAVQNVMESRHWTFLDRRVALAKVQLVFPSVDATVLLLTTGLAHGLVVGSPVSFALAPDGTGVLPVPFVANRRYYVRTVVSPTQFSLTETVGGFGPAVTPASVGSGAWRIQKESDRADAFMYAVPVDCRTERNIVPASAPDDWPGMGAFPTSGIGAVANSIGGLHYSLAGGYGTPQPIPYRRAINDAGEQVIYTDLDNAHLVYSRNIDDTTHWPPAFKQAVVFTLGADFAGAIKRDSKLVDWCLQRAQAFISEASRIDSTRVVVTGDRPYAWRT